MNRDRWIIAVLAGVLIIGGIFWLNSGSSNVANDVKSPNQVVAQAQKLLSPKATVGQNCGQKDCVIVPFQHYTVKNNEGVIGNFGNCKDVPNNGNAKVVRCEDENGFTAVFVHDKQNRLREVKHDRG